MKRRFKQILFRNMLIFAGACLHLHAKFVQIPWISSSYSEFLISAYLCFFPPKNYPSRFREGDRGSENQSNPFVLRLGIKGMYWSCYNSLFFIFIFYIEATRICKLTSNLLDKFYRQWIYVQASYRYSIKKAPCHISTVEHEYLSLSWIPVPMKN